MAEEDPPELKAESLSNALADDSESDVRSASLSKLLDALRYCRNDPHSRGDTWGGGIVLIGAGCSASAGIPLALGIVDMLLRRMALHAGLGTKAELEQMEGRTVYELLKAKKYLKRITSDYEGPKLYGELFREIFPDPAVERQIIREAIKKGNDKINWAHLRLGQLIAQRYIHTVITTNFDQLALQGVVKNGIFPAVADGLEALDRVDPQPSTPQVLHIHGSLHNYRRIHSLQQIQNANRRRQLSVSISSLLKAAPFLLIVGYRGEEEALMFALEEALTSFDGKQIYWAFHDQKPSAAALRLQEAHNATLMLEQDADRLFDSLAKGLNLGLPEWMAASVENLVRDFDKIVQPRDIAELKIIFGKHAEKLSQLKNFEEVQFEAKRNDPSGPDFAAALLRGDLEAARKALNLNFMATEKWAALAIAAADAIVEREQDSASVFLTEAYEKLKTTTHQYFEPINELRIAEAFLEIADFEASRQMLAAVYATLKDEKEKLLWAALQHRLGFKLSTNIKTRDNADRIGEAVAAYRAALKERTRERAPRAWSGTQNNLGVALRRLSDLTENSEFLHEAIAAYHEALQVRTRARTPSYWAATSSNLAIALTALGTLMKDTSKIEKAVDLFYEIISAQSRDNAPEKWADLQDKLGYALWSLGLVKRDAGHLVEAITAHRRSLEIKTRETAPLRWARTTEKLAWVENTLGNITGDASHWRAALIHVEESLEEYRAADAEFYIKEANELRDDLLAKLSL